MCMIYIYIYIYTNQHKSCFTPVACLQTYTLYKADLEIEMYIYISGFYPSTFVYSRFFSKIEFLYCFLSQYLLRYPYDGQ